MDGNYTELAVKVEGVDNRAKSLEHRVDTHDTEIKELREGQKTLIKLTNSVETIAKSVADINKKVDTIENKQDKLNDKVTVLENRPSVEAKERIDDILGKLLWLVVGGIAVAALTSIIPNIPW